MDKDLLIRLTAFQWLKEQVQRHGDVLPLSLLREGFQRDNELIHLVSPQGIFKPKGLDLPLSITTAPKGPYDDSFSVDGLLLYRYRGTDPNHPDNSGLRKCMVEKRPLIYFHGIVPGQYLAVWPVYIVGDDPSTLTFRVAVDDVQAKTIETGITYEPEDEIRRAYLTASIRQRVHQRLFRERVLDAYRSRCSFCNLRHRELLDAAHIVPDSEASGEPKIVNGLALCKLHHAAFDSFMIGVTSDYIIHVREDILSESDGPILQHGLKGLNESRLLLPSNEKHWPDRALLDWRWERYKKVS